MRGWRAWYTDGRVFSSGDSAWADLPEEGCLFVMEYLEIPHREPPYREPYHNFDWIWLGKDGRFHTVRTHPEWGKWVASPEGVTPHMLKRGEAVSDEEWERVQAEAMEAREWP